MFQCVIKKNNKTGRFSCYTTCKSAHVLDDSRNDGVLEEFHVNVRGVRWTTIEEGDADAHEEGDDDEAETSAVGVNESEPVYPTL